MSTLSSFIIFILILLVYIHITSQFKKSEDLEIYEADYNYNQQIQDICDIRQPVLFNIQQSNPVFFEHNISDLLLHSKTDYEVHVKDIHDNQSGDSILLPFRSASGLMEADDNSRFYSENNFEVTTDIIEHHYQSMDELLKPKYTAQTKYDILFGSDGSHTTTRYHTHYRHFLCVQTGRVTVKMTPFRSRKLLHVENDYDNYEFRSRIDVWEPQEQYMNDMEQLKFLEFDVHPGFVLYVPPYWFYSIKYHTTDTGSALVAGFTYNSVMNLVANSPQWAMYYLQQYNTTKKTVKTMDLTNLKSVPKMKATKEPEQRDVAAIVTDAPLEPTLDFTERANEQVHS
jgi:hypothetical protein